jgi:hypothetical protein
VTLTRVRPIAALRKANAECRRALLQWNRVQAQLAPATDQLSEKERRHLRQTAFRINALMCLYAWLRRTAHDTELGVLLGVITHLLDHVYDHRGLTGDQLRDVEEVVFLKRNPDPTDPFQVVLADLCKQAWASVPDSDALRSCLREMLATQRRSLAQMDQTTMDVQALHQLTWDKGHHSLCLYFAAANPTFSGAEADALRSFGLYMQLMDDLEDLYEDREEQRTSPVSNVLRAARDTTRCFISALRDLAGHYGRDPVAYDWQVFKDWLILFHVGILFFCLLREVTRRLPTWAQRLLDQQHRIGPLTPFIYAAPFDLVRTPAAPGRATASRDAPDKSTGPSVSGRRTG